MKKSKKFKEGDLVRVAKDLGPYMRHFTSDCDAIVLESDGELENPEYVLYLKGKGEAAWYEEDQLTLIEAQRLDLLEQWKAEAEKEAKLKSSLDWIFENGDRVLESAHSASIAALAECLELEDLWGKSGEAITYYSNAITILQMAEPFLRKGDKDGWLKYSKTIRSQIQRKPVATPQPR